MLVVDLEAERFDEMQRCHGCGAQARHASGIRWDLGFEEHDMHDDSRPDSGAALFD
jgi:hypothetical protein